MERNWKLITEHDDLNIIAYHICNWGKDKQFEMPDSIKEADGVLAKLMLVVSEMGEASDAVRVQDVENFAEEMMDGIIRILHMCGRMKIDIITELAHKMEINEKRPIKHGKVC